MARITLTGEEFVDMKVIEALAKVGKMYDWAEDKGMQNYEAQITALANFVTEYAATLPPEVDEELIFALCDQRNGDGAWSR